jgi:hypothetical protein
MAAIRLFRFRKRAIAREIVPVQKGPNHLKGMRPKALHEGVMRCVGGIAKFVGTVLYWSGTPNAVHGVVRKV